MCFPSKTILKLHGVLLTILGGITCLISITGFYLAKGPFRFLKTNEVAAIGFIEAYGLACLLGFSLIIAATKSYHCSWHLVATVIHLLLFFVNIRFWHLYQPLNLEPAGLLATSFHFCLIFIEAICFFRERRSKNAAR